MPESYPYNNIPDNDVLHSRVVGELTIR